jgi:hypothetical protein
LTRSASVSVMRTRSLESIGTWAKEAAAGGSY